MDSFANINSKIPINGSQVNYGDLKSPCLAAEIISTSVQPNTTSTITGANSSKTCIIEIPTESNPSSFLMHDKAFLRFTIIPRPTMTTTTVGSGSLATTATNFAIGQVDGPTFSSIFKHIRIYYGSTIVETIESYNDIFNMLFMNNVSEGDLNRWTFAGYDDLATTPKFNLCRGFSTLGTANTTTNTSIDFSGTGNGIEVCIPIMSSLIGFEAQRACPIGMISQSIRIEIVFSDPEECLFYPSAAQSSAESAVAGYTPVLATTAADTALRYTITNMTYDVTNINFHYDILRLSNSAFALVSQKAAQEGGIIYNGIGWAAVSDKLISQTNKTFSDKFSMGYSSLKSLYAIFHPVANRVKTARYLTNFIFPNLNYYRFKIGNDFVSDDYIGSDYYSVGYSSTSTPPLILSRHWTELQKSFHTCHNIQDCQQLYTAKQYSDTTVASSLTTAPCYVIGAELEIYGSGMSNVLQQGRYTFSNDIYFQMNSFANVSTTTDGIYATFLGMYDLYFVVRISPDGSVLNGLQVLI